MKLEFYGAAGGVTGSHSVLDVDGFRVGVDAGLFQGGDARRGQTDFGHDPRDLEALLLTHAHIDHSGRIPLLVKEGFRGAIYSTSATADLCEILLRDSARLMAEKAEIEGRSHEIRGSEPEARLYTEEDVAKALKRFKPVLYGNALELGNLSVTFRDAGHILGSSMLEIDLGGRKLVFSGDLGRPGTPFLRDPEKIAKADWLVLESTYGNRDHGDRKELGKRLMQIVMETIDKGGNVVIPSFAIGRAQDILFMLNPYAEKGELKGIKSFVDSPMSISAIEVYRRHPECFDAETMAMLKRNDSPLEFPGIQYVRSREDSKAINAVKEPHIIISANGMCTGGRILHHLLHNLEREACTIILVGYQAEGTLGRRLLTGAKKVRVMGREVEVRARIESLDGFSAHADKSEIMKWLDDFDEFPTQVFLNHGEPEASGSLAEAIRDKFAVQPVTAKGGESYNLA